MLPNRLKNLIPLLALTGLAVPTGAMAAGVGVMPGSLEMEAYPLISDTAAITVTNTATEEGLYQIYLEGEVGEWLTITPTEFVLTPGASRSVEITAEPPLGARGDYDLTICAVARSPSSGLKVGCGVKVPLRISVGLAPPAGRIAELIAGSYLKWLVIGVVVAAVVIPLAVRRRRRHAL